MAARRIRDTPKPLHVPASIAHSCGMHDGDIITIGSETSPAIAGGDMSGFHISPQQKWHVIITP